MVLNGIDLLSRGFNAINCSDTIVPVQIVTCKKL